MEQHEALDKILEHIISHPKEAYNEYRLQKELFPSTPIEILKHLVDHIKDYPVKPKIVEWYQYKDGGIMANTITKQFYDSGGFTNAYQKESSKSDQQDEFARRQIQKLNLEIDDLVNRLTGYNTVKNQAKWSIILAVISAITALIALLK